MKFFFSNLKMLKNFQKVRDVADSFFPTVGGIVRKIKKISDTQKMKN